jgi:hypothetical protein
MLFSGFIGPVPVTVWASIGLGIDILIESRTFVDVRPFAALEGSGKSSVESHAFVLGDVKPEHTRARSARTCSSASRRSRPG